MAGPNKEEQASILTPDTAEPQTDTEQTKMQIPDDAEGVKTGVKRSLGDEGEVKKDPSVGNGPEEGMDMDLSDGEEGEGGDGQAAKRRKTMTDVEALQKFMPQVELKTLETVEGGGCSHVVAIPSNSYYIPLHPIEKPIKSYPFTLDVFQQRAVECVDNYQSVLVSAHTSAGKTVVAE